MKSFREYTDNFIIEDDEEQQKRERLTNDIEVAKASRDKFLKKYYEIIERKIELLDESNENDEEQQKRERLTNDIEVAKANRDEFLKKYYEIIKRKIKLLDESIAKIVSENDKNKVIPLLSSYTSDINFFESFDDTTKQVEAHRKRLTNMI